MSSAAAEHLPDSTPVAGSDGVSVPAPTDPSVPGMAGFDAGRLALALDRLRHLANRPGTAAEVAAECDAVQPPARVRRELAERLLGTNPMPTEIELIAIFRIGSVAEDITRAVVTHAAAGRAVWRYVAREARRPIDRVVLARVAVARRDPEVREALQGFSEPVVDRYCCLDETGEAFRAAFASLARRAPREAVRLLEHPALRPEVLALTADAVQPILATDDVRTRWRGQYALRVLHEYADALATPVSADAPARSARKRGRSSTATSA